MDPLRVAVIGCGKAGQAQLHCFQRRISDCEIAAVYDPLAERACALAEQYDAARASSWQGSRVLSRR